MNYCTRRTVALLLLGLFGTVLPLSAQQVLWERLFVEDSVEANHTLHVLSSDSYRGGQTVVDVQGHVHLVGRSGQRSARVFYIQLAPDGELLRRLLFYDDTATGTSLTSYGRPVMQVEESGAVAILMGRTLWRKGHDVAIVRLDSAGSPRDTIIDESPGGFFDVVGSRTAVKNQRGFGILWSNKDTTTSIRWYDSSGQHLSQIHYAVPTLGPSARMLGLADLSVAPNRAGYLLLGASAPALDTATLLIRTDSAGNEVWRRSISDTGASFVSDLPMTVVPTTDGGAVLVRRMWGSYNYSMRGDYANVVRVDSAGNILWWRNLAHLRPTMTRINAGCGAADDGVVLVGSAVHYDDHGNFPDTRDTQFYALKLDKGGRILWEFNYGRAEKTEYLNDVVLLGDTLVVCGRYIATDSTDGMPDYRLYVAKLLPPPPASVRSGRAVDVSLSPNPVHERLHLTLELPEQKQSTIEIVDLLGRCVRALGWGGGEEAELDVSDLKSGYYQARIVVEGHVLYARGFMKQ